MTKQYDVSGISTGAPMMAPMTEFKTIPGRIIQLAGERSVLVARNPIDGSFACTLTSVVGGDVVELPFGMSSAAARALWMLLESYMGSSNENTPTGWSTPEADMAQIGQMQDVDIFIRHPAQETKKYSNHFETAVIVHNGVQAFDTGVCTHHDDDKVTVVVPMGAGLQVAYRYGDAREDDEIPAGLEFLSAKEAQEQLGISVVVEA